MCNCTLINSTFSCLESELAQRWHTLQVLSLFAIQLLDTPLFATTCPPRLCPHSFTETRANRSSARSRLQAVACGEKSRNTSEWDHRAGLRCDDDDAFYLFLQPPPVVSTPSKKKKGPEERQARLAACLSPRCPTV